MSDLLDEIYLRYSCREFMRGQPLSPIDIALVLEAGRLAPSAFGLEPWRFVVVDEAQRIDVVVACQGQPPAATAAALVVIVALVAALEPSSDYVRDRLMAEARDGEVDPIMRAYRAFHDPASASVWAVGQCYFAAAHMLLQATHMELGSCAMGGFDPAALSKALALPPGEVPALVVALGRCAHPAPPRRRKLEA